MRDKDVKGIRYLATRMPSWLLPDPARQGEMIIETLHDLSLRIDPSKDKGVELSLFQTGTYERGILDFIHHNYASKGSFIDIGANIGLMSLFVQRHFPQAEVHAFEAHPETAQLFRDNCTLNDLSAVHLHEVALGNGSGTVYIYDNWAVNRGGATLVPQGKDAVRHEVQLFRLDDLEVGHPEMVKIDVEGLELDVLKGAETTLRKFRPILIVEVSENRENAHHASSEILEFIQDLGNYQVFKLKGGKERRSTLVEIRSAKDLPQHDNILCLPR